MQMERDYILQGQLNASGLAGSKVDIDMTLPQAVMLSGYHQLTERLAVMGNIGWQDWSEFGKQDLTRGRRLRPHSPRIWTTMTPGTSPWAHSIGLPTDGCGLWERLTIPRQPMRTPAHRIYPLTGRFASAPESNTTGIKT
jgi:hypothetical protein